MNTEKEMSRDLNASDMEACRICLATDVKLHSLQDTRLGTCMQSIAGFTNTSVGLPNYVCYQCAPILLKCGKLIEKSKTAQATLLDIFVKNGQLTKTHLKEQNRSEKNLESSLGSCFLLNYDYILYESGNDNASESNQTKSVPDIKIETVKPETKDEKTETDKAELDYSVEEIKVETPIIEVSDDEDFISLVPHMVKGKLKKCTKGISTKFQGFRRPQKKNLKRKLRESPEPTIWSEFINIQRDFTVSKIPFKEQVTIWRQSMVLKCTVKSESECNDGKISFPNADLLQEHSDLHKPSIHGILKCEVCLAFFSSNQALDYHTETTHANRFNCKNCPMGFNNLEDAKCHKDLCLGSKAHGGSIRRGRRAMPYV